MGVAHRWLGLVLLTALAGRLSSQETSSVPAVLTDTLSRYTAEAGAGRLERAGPARWRWIAPRAKGVSAIVVRDSASGETVALHAFVMVPRPAGTTIDGFRVGRYEPRALGRDPG